MAGAVEAVILFEELVLELLTDRDGTLAGFPDPNRAGSADVEVVSVQPAHGPDVVFESFLDPSGPTEFEGDCELLAKGSHVAVSRCANRATRRRRLTLDLNCFTFPRPGQVAL